MTPLHHAIVGLACFGFGACVGSFLNVCIYRLPRRLSLWRPRSRCPKCLTPIAPVDNVPVVGWLMLRGRCRRCSQPISVRYPAVEALVGLCFAGLYLADAGLAHADLLERGLLPVAARLLVLDLVIATAIAVLFILRDRKACAVPVESRSPVRPSGR